MKRWYYSDSISVFKSKKSEEILGHLSTRNEFSLESTQKRAWNEEIALLKTALDGFDGQLYFEYTIPRMGRRIDVLALIGPVIFVLEFKVGESTYNSYAVDQVVDYALDLKNFHETSQPHFIAPILIATDAKSHTCITIPAPHDDGIFPVTCCNNSLLGSVIAGILNLSAGDRIEYSSWEIGKYHPSPTIVEAAMALYNGHAVEEISRSDASAQNLSVTSDCISSIIQRSKASSCKAICFLTGVPGAGKTLVGLNIATKHIDKQSELYSVFLSGNGPLVAILREALTRDKLVRERTNGKKITKGSIMSEVKLFIQNIHHFRDDCLADETQPPIEHVALFDEAQRAWNLEQTAAFMQQKKNKPGFQISEPEFLISCLDRHPDWAVIVCLVGGGQEINTGEAGISEWIEALNRSYPHWHIHISSKLFDSEYGAGEVLERIKHRANVKLVDELHLAVSMRSFRAEEVSLLIKQILDIDEQSVQTLKRVSQRFPIVITRDLQQAKKWLKQKARGSERYGIVVSSQAERLKPHAIDVKSPIDPVHWFLDGKDDVRSSFYLEDVATEFQTQGLELDWVCVTWDADFRYTDGTWQHWSFRGSKWQRIHKPERQKYQKNAYRVLLTRARQGMVIVVPPGDKDDPTRMPEFYNDTFNYLANIGFERI